ncbi:Ulp1 protease family, carboxy-terminal domain protein [Arachis hypogaea]|nr:Ulp1 protease family, carboxy-terminal domain protein [Arachis hypogaea]
MPTLNQENIEHNKRRIEWPSWIPILFKPPAYMDLDDLDIKMATYVFAPNKRSDEYLVTTNKFSGTRDNFKSLIPKEQGTWGYLVATMLTMQEKEIGCQTHWYLPAVFLVCNVFFKLNNTHWYLVVFDLCNHQTILLDSLPIVTNKEQKRSSIVKLAKYLEDMLKYDSFYKYNTPFRPRIFDFAFVDMLETGEQAPDS